MLRLVRGLRASALLYVGDDLTDEFGFRAELPVPFVSVRVGHPRKSAAAFYVRSQGEVDLPAGSAARTTWRGRESGGQG